MVQSRRRRALLVLALVLVTVPLWTPALDVTGRDYQYRAATVTVEDNRLTMPERTLRLSEFEHVDCFRTVEPQRRCAFEGNLLNGSTVTAAYPGVRHSSGNPTLYSDRRYVAFPGDGRLFKPTTGWNDSREAYILGLERANASAFLDEYARPLEQFEKPIRRAVRTGESRADDELTEPELVADGDDYAIVYDAGTRQFLSEKPLTERVFEGGAVLAGVLVLRRVWTDGT